MVAMAALAACRASYPALVSGSVTLDGVPLPQGTVTLHPERGGVPGYGTIEPDGRFVVKTGRRAGVEPGQYALTVNAAEPAVVPADGGMPSPGRLLVPARYTIAETSGLRYTVQMGDNRIDLALRSIR